MLIDECRSILCDITPLSFDCGQTCGHRCCHSLDGEESGMLLFPGEELLYQDDPSFRIIESKHGKLLVCNGHCARQARPLSCMIFPLIPLLREGQIRIAIDERARNICPIADNGLRSVRPDFKDAVKAVGNLLLAQSEIRQFLQSLTDEHDELKKLRSEFL